ncbi:hypothetical protein ACIQNG_02715 [Streptomyces sp. NPDC091377]|uniref:hypothetical protein n=1 Tax=Streptomyces sp. NPDC091377 TaxID=3365995 RepID=UPI00382B0993
MPASFQITLPEIGLRSRFATAYGDHTLNAGPQNHDGIRSLMDQVYPDPLLDTLSNNAEEVAMIAAIVTAGASMAIAVIAYWLNHRGEVRRSLRAARIDWVSSQLKDLYGPLLVLAETNERAWKEYRRAYFPANLGEPEEGPLSESMSMLWHMWVETVFAPRARQIREIVTARGDLIIEREMPAVLLDFCAHAASYDALLADWDSASVNNSTLIRHPGSSFLSYVRESYDSLKAEQEYLLDSRRPN